MLEAAADLWDNLHLWRRCSTSLQAIHSLQCDPRACCRNSWSWFFLLCLWSYPGKECPCPTRSRNLPAPWTGSLPPCRPDSPRQTWAASTGRSGTLPGHCLKTIYNIHWALKLLLRPWVCDWCCRLLHCVTEWVFYKSEAGPDVVKDGKLHTRGTVGNAGV